MLPKIKSEDDTKLSPHTYTKHLMFQNFFIITFLTYVWFAHCLESFTFWAYLYLYGLLSIKHKFFHTRF